MSGHRLEAWERRLTKILDEIDDRLEEVYGSHYPLRPNRPQRGHTANKKYDGLFSIEAKYSLGLGSKLGEGYSVDIRLSTLAQVPKEVRDKIHEEVATMLSEKLATAFPDRELKVSRDGMIYKIHGDLSF
jgi:hypothetical protein